MKSQFALDLHVARRNAGLTQRDCAHLLTMQISRFSEIENGKCLPKLPEICKLSLIFGRSFESLYAELFRQAREVLKVRIVSMPKDTRVYVGTRNRESTVERLAIRLADETADREGA